MAYRVDYTCPAGYRRPLAIRPLISLEVRNPNNGQRLVLGMSLADTGATSVTLEASIAIQLGFTTPDPGGNKPSVLLWRGSRWTTWLETAELSLVAATGERLSWNAEIKITDAPLAGLAKLSALVGQRGGLDLFRTTFCPDDCCLRIEPLATSNVRVAP